MDVGEGLYRFVKDISDADTPVIKGEYAQNANLINFQQLANAINAGASAIIATPRIVNETYLVANAIQSIALTANTFKILIKHRNKGSIDFSFDAALTTFISMPKGGIYSDDGFTLVGKTLYFRSPVTGTIELLEYSFA